KRAGIPCRARLLIHGCRRPCARCNGRHCSRNTQPARSGGPGPAGWQRPINGRLPEREPAIPRISMFLMMVFALVALVMTGVGLYGVMAYGVSQRTHEIGIRMALGAHRRSVLHLVIGEGMAQAAIGSAAGLVIALGITHSMASLLFGTSPTDRATFVGVTLVL